MRLTTLAIAPAVLAATAAFAASGGATLNANITNNTFTQNGTFDAFTMSSTGATTQVNLNLNNNSATGAAGADSNDYELTTAGRVPPDFNFAVTNRDTTAGNNIGDVHFNPAIGEFDTIATPPESPTVP